MLIKCNNYCVTFPVLPKNQQHNQIDIFGKIRSERE